MIQGQRSMPVLSVKNVEKSADFFSDGLGFSVAGFWKDDEGKVSFAIVVMDKITIGLQRGKTNKTDSWAAYFYVLDIDALAVQAASSGVKIIHDVAEQPYGCRDFEIEDLDGNILCFGQDASPGENGPGL